MEDSGTSALPRRSQGIHGGTGRSSSELFTYGPDQAHSVQQEVLRRMRVSIKHSNQNALGHVPDLHNKVIDFSNLPKDSMKALSCLHILRSEIDRLEQEPTRRKHRRDSSSDLRLEFACLLSSASTLPGFFKPPA